MAIRPINLSLNLVLNRIRVRTIITPHPLKLIANIIRDTRIDISLLLEVLFAQPAH
jgi:hypothetical protein